MGRLDKSVLELLKGSPEPLTLAEIAERLDKPPKTIFKTLRRLFGKGKIDSRGRRYSVATE